MDPLSITAGIVGLLSAVGKTILAVTSFIRSYKEARTDLTAVNRELLELQIVLELLRDDGILNENSVFPQALQAQILSVIANCNTIIKHINTVLEKHEASTSMPLKWAASGKREVASLQISLEAHRGSLNLALEMINILVSKSIKEDTKFIRSGMSGIKQDTSQIAQIMEELITLREVVANIGSSPQTAGSNYVLQQYLDNLTCYAETISQGDLNESRNDSVDTKSQESSLDCQRVVATERDISVDVGRKWSEMEHGSGNTMRMISIEKGANGDNYGGAINIAGGLEPGNIPVIFGVPTQEWNFDDDQNFSGTDLSSPHEIAGEGQAPGSRTLPMVLSNASTTQLSQDNLTPYPTKTIICVGESFVGKTSFLVKWSQGLFTEVPCSGALEPYSKNNVLTNGKPIKFTVWDTPSQEWSEKTRIAGYPDKDVVLICFNIANPNSFANIQSKWIMEVLRFCADVPYILVGLKKDLRFDQETLNRLRKAGWKPVSREEGEELRKKIGAFSYIECSAKTSEGVDEIFSAAVAATAAKPQPRARWFRFFHKP